LPQNLAGALQHYLPTEIFGYLQAAGQAAAERQLSLYLIGGSVRDMLLQQQLFDWDLDLVSESPQITTLAADLHQRWGGSFQQFPQYGTAKIHLGALDLDFATARTEVYAYPGANPEVTFSQLEADLIRRDFTINAMALDLRPARFGDLIDPFGGYADLAAGRIRALHAHKFIEDPVRSWRAVRLATTLSFNLEPTTEQALCAAMQSGQFDGFLTGRICNELYKCLDKAEPEVYLSHLSHLGVLRCLDPGLCWNSALARFFERAREYAEEFAGLKLRQAYLLGLLQAMQPVYQSALLRALQVSRAEFKAWSAYQAEVQASWEPVLPSVAVERLSPLPLLTLWALLATDLPEPAADLLQHYWRQWRFIKPEISGKLILDWMAPGPAVREILKQVHRARLNGQVQNLQEEKELARKLAQDT